MGTITVMMSPVISLDLIELNKEFRPVAQLVEYRSPKPRVGGSRPSWPAI
jgi:hypothetical protein